jgi:hypothetical protein
VERIGGATPPISQIVGDETHVYWQDELAIRRASRADGTVEMFFDKPDGWGPLVLTATHVVWAQGKDPAGSPVLRKKKQGGGSPETIAAMQRASDLASDGTRVYWTDSRRWVRWDPATPETRTSFAVPQFVSSIAVDGTTVAFNRFTDKGGIDVLDTCGCGSDVLVPDAAPP